MFTLTTSLVPKWDSRYNVGYAVESRAAAREVVAQVIRRNIEIAEAGALGARYRDMFDSAAVLDQQVLVWRELLVVVEGDGS